MYRRFVLHSISKKVSSFFESELERYGIQLSNKSPTSFSLIHSLLSIIYIVDIFCCCNWDEFRVGSCICTLKKRKNVCLLHFFYQKRSTRSCESSRVICSSVVFCVMSLILILEERKRENGEWHSSILL